MSKKIRWGVLGAAKIAVKSVIPAMQKGMYSEVTAIASRDLEKARQAAGDLDIPKFYGSYEELINDAEIDAIYNPLPNNLHVEWTIKAAEAGKHILCEKPIAMTVEEAQKLIETRRRTGVKIQEAFMVRSHPQWLAVRELIEQERIGSLQTINGFFSYFNDDAANIRNQTKTGGGALFDIGCYCINLPRFILGEEPRKVTALIKRDDESKVDKLTSAILDFPTCLSTFTCSTQLVPYQRMEFFGTKGRIEVEIPVNIPVDRPTRIFVDNTGDLYGANTETIEIPAVNQYTIQGDLFSRAILENSEQAISLEDSVKNMSVIEAVFRAADTGNWEIPEIY
ncbi:MAG: Gfo/Idh/MocA family oxidoreductase [Acidobacteriota bacterium]|nr:Gfo/Idh/MocA family oxidoreductase [Acidobacteriota bacterium]